MATNTGLRRACTVWATFYDVVVRFLRGSRRRSFALLDRFWNRPAPPPLPLRIANAVLGGFVTAVNRNFHALLAQTSVEVVREVPLGFGGLYVLHLLRKPGKP